MLIGKEEMLQVGSAFCYSLQPDTQRLVIVQFQRDQKVFTVGARFKSGKGWISEHSGDPLLLSHMAVWGESIVSDPFELQAVENEPEPMPRMTAA
jgi:hypothetical protein